MCSGRKKPPEALQVEDHRALGKAEARSPLWQGAWKPGCLPEAYLVLGILSHLTQLGRKSGGQEIPHQGQRSTLWVLHPGREGCEQVMDSQSGLACQGQHLLPHEEFARWSAPLSVWEMGLPWSVIPLPNLWKEPLWVPCGAVTDTWISSHRVTHYCSYSSLLPWAGSYPSLWARLPWITSQVPWDHTCI